MEIRRTLPRGFRAPGEGRQSLFALVPLLPPRTLDDARQAITELVTNALLHGPGGAEAIELTLRVEPGLLTIEVRDFGKPFVPDVVPPPEATGRTGLWIVDQLADRWGVRSGQGTCVWAEFRY